MTDYARQGQTFRSTTVSAKEMPILLAGAHVRTYKESPQNLTATTAAQALTVPAGATHADVYCEGTASTDFVRYLHGTTNPTASVGVKLKDHEIIASADPSTLSIILGTGSGACTVRVEYYAYE